LFVGKANINESVNEPQQSKGQEDSSIEAKLMQLPQYVEAKKIFTIAQQRFNFQREMYAAEMQLKEKRTEAVQQLEKLGIDDQSMPSPFKAQSDKRSRAQRSPNKQIASSNISPFAKKHRILKQEPDDYLTEEEVIPEPAPSTPEMPSELQVPVFEIHSGSSDSEKISTTCSKNNWCLHRFYWLFLFCMYH